MKKKKILIIDDEQIILDVASVILEHLGFESVKALNGNKALEIYKKYKNEIILAMIDINMTILDGKETCLKLREINDNLPVIFTSGNKYDGIHFLKEFDSVEFVNKPFVLLELKQKLLKLLKLQNINDI